MTEQTPLPNTQPAMEILYLSKRPITMQALVETPSMVLAG